MRGTFQAATQAIVITKGSEPATRPYGRRLRRTGHWGKPFPLRENQGKYYLRKPIRLKDGEEVCVIANWIQGSLKRLEKKKK